MELLIEQQKTNNTLLLLLLLLLLFRLFFSSLTFGRNSPDHGPGAQNQTVPDQWIDR